MSMLSVLRGKLCETVERSDSTPPIHVGSHIRFDGKSEPVKIEDCDNNAVNALTSFVSEADGQSQKIPKPSITSNRSRKDRLVSSAGDDDTPLIETQHMRSRTDPREIWLHVYDLGPVTSRLNELVLRGANLGAFHAGVEVLNTEWSFMGFYDAWDDHELSGVVQNSPRQHPSYIFRESLFMGISSLSASDIEGIIRKMCARWRAHSYHWVSCNCIDFAEELVAAVGATQPFPAYLRGAIDLGKTPALFAVADAGWTWFKWLSARQAEKELAELQNAEYLATKEHEANTCAEKEAIPTSISERRREAPTMHRGRVDSLTELAEAQAQLAEDLARLRFAKSRLQSAVSSQRDQLTIDCKI